jgi:hypothetical protein
MVNTITAAIGDLVLTFIWMFITSTLGLITSEIINFFDLQFVSYNGVNYPFIIITTVLIFIIIFTFTAIGNAMGGASFNPTGNASFYAAGLGSDTLFSMALRFPAQVFLYSKSAFFFKLFFFGFRVMILLNKNCCFCIHFLVFCHDYYWLFFGGI